MAYQTALTIAEVINDIHRKKYLLPAIQREFVWKTDQIENIIREELSSLLNVAVTEEA